MIVLDAVLPQIQRAVAERTECKELTSMDAPDLCELVYKLVERQRPSALNDFSKLVASAAEHHSDMGQARDHSVTIRHEILKSLLDMIKPALPSLLGAIDIEVINPPDGHEQRKTHPLLVGFELLNGKNSAPVGSDNYGRSGRSWWIVGLTPEDPTDLVEPRYATLRHFGKTDEHGVGRTWSKIELVKSTYAAAQIRDHKFQKILKRLHERMTALSGTKVIDATDDLWRIAALLDAGLTAMSEST